MLLGPYTLMQLRRCSSRGPGPNGAARCVCLNGSESKHDHRCFTTGWPLLCVRRIAHRAPRRYHVATANGHLMWGFGGSSTLAMALSSKPAGGGRRLTPLWPPPSGRLGRARRGGRHRGEGRWDRCARHSARYASFAREPRPLRAALRSIVYFGRRR